MHYFSMNKIVQEVLRLAGASGCTYKKRKYHFIYTVAKLDRLPLPLRIGSQQASSNAVPSEDS